MRQNFVPELELKNVNTNHCQYPHWGYILKGRMRLIYPDHEEIYQAGDVYHAMPSRLRYFDAGCESIEFSPTLEFNKVKEAARDSLDESKSSTVQNPGIA